MALLKAVNIDVPNIFFKIDSFSEVEDFKNLEKSFCGSRIIFLNCSAFKCKSRVISSPTFLGIVAIFAFSIPATLSTIANLAVALKIVVPLPLFLAIFCSGFRSILYNKSPCSK